MTGELFVTSYIQLTTITFHGLTKVICGNILKVSEQQKPELITLKGNQSKPIFLFLRVVKETKLLWTPIPKAAGKFLKTTGMRNPVSVYLLHMMRNLVS